MRAKTIGGWTATLAFAVAACSKGTPPNDGKISAETLAVFLPDALGGISVVAKDKVPDPALAHAAYLEGTRSINVNLGGVREAGPVLALGEKKDGDVVTERGIAVRGIAGQRTFYRRSKQSEVRVVVSKRLEITVSVQPAADPDEALKIVEGIDLEGLSKLRD